MRHLKAALMAWVLSVGGALAAPQGFALHDTPQSVANVLCGWLPHSKV